MGAAQDLAPGKRNPKVDAEGGDKMTGAEVDAIKEAADAAAWEEQTKEEPNVQAAIDLLTKAVDTLAQVQEYLSQAAEAVEDSPETHRIASIENDVAEIELYVRAQIRRM
jgi:hypothetical protein